MTPISFTLPWPPASLSPNGPQGKWRAFVAAKKAYRDTCYVSILEQKVRPRSFAPFAVEMIFTPPGDPRPDLDNMIARMKSGLDGVAMAWGIDDRLFARIEAELTDNAPTRQDAHVRVTVRLKNLSLAAAEATPSGPGGPAAVGLSTPRKEP